MAKTATNGKRGEFRGLGVSPALVDLTNASGNLEGCSYEVPPRFRTNVRRAEKCIKSAAALLRVVESAALAQQEAHLRAG